MDSAPELNMTPQETVDALDRYIIGQNDAKKAVAVALRNRWRRLQLDEDLKDEISKGIFNPFFIKTFDIDEKTLLSVWKEHQEGKKDHKWFLFTIYSLQQWHENLKK